MPTYRSTGTLTDFIPSERVVEAQAYLTDDDMTQYLDPPLRDVTVHVGWALHDDGHGYHVDATTTRELTEDELRELASWTSGQNSDGLGEGFEQQDFAWLEDEPYDEDEEDWYGDSGHMVSFDWEKNDSIFTRIS